MDCDRHAARWCSDYCHRLSYFSQFLQGPWCLACHARRPSTKICIASEPCAKAMDWINGNDQFWRFCRTRRSNRGNRCCNRFNFRFVARFGCREKNNAAWLRSGCGTFSCLRRTTRWRFLRARSHPSRLYCQNIYANRNRIRDGRCDGSNNFEISRSNFRYRAHSYRSKSDALGADSTICIAGLDRWTLCRRFRSWHEICTSCIQPSSYSVARQASSWRCAACRMRRGVDIAASTTITDDDHRNKCRGIAAILWQWI